MTTQIAHTPGPWHIGGPGFEDQVFTEAGFKTGQDDIGEYFICETGGNIKNAALIAAAPDLLEALRMIANQSCGPDWTPEQAMQFVRIHARAAIALVKGGAA